MTKLGNFVVSNALFCEDIRQERSNKFILIGVFAGDILVAELPATMPLTFYIDGYLLEPGEYPLRARISGPGDGEVIMSSMMRSSETRGSAALAGPRAQLLLECEGTLSLSLSLAEGRWKTVVEKRVILSSDLLVS